MWTSGLKGLMDFFKTNLDANSFSKRKISSLWWKLSWNNNQSSIACVFDILEISFNALNFPLWS